MDWIAVRGGFGVGAIVGMTGMGGRLPTASRRIPAFKPHPAVAIGAGLPFPAPTEPSGPVAPACAAPWGKRLVRGMPERPVRSLLRISPAAAGPKAGR